MNKMVMLICLPRGFLTGRVSYTKHCSKATQEAGLRECARESVTSSYYFFHTQSIIDNRETSRRPSRSTSWKLANQALLEVQGEPRGRRIGNKKKKKNSNRRECHENLSGALVSHSLLFHARDLYPTCQTSRGLISVPDRSAGRLENLLVLRNAITTFRPPPHRPFFCSRELAILLFKLLVQKEANVECLEKEW
ncbi:hypothetical protein TNCV_2859501 [Trichonephila clavipes]|nr:hypothetical protein TNCV_2859501 [Trichonephila clavipes]